MKRLVCTFVVWAVLDVVGLASPPKAIVSDLAEVSLNQGITSVPELPPKLKGALAKTFGQRTLYLGNPNEPLGDEILVAGRPHYPDRRLIFAFQTPKYYVVYVEYRPPAVHASALVFGKTKAESLPFVWGGVDMRMPPFAKSPGKLAKLIRAGKLREGRFIW
jgi:hypothetical protein